MKNATYRSVHIMTRQELWKNTILMNNLYVIFLFIKKKDSRWMSNGRKLDFFVATQFSWNDFFDSHKKIDINCMNFLKYGNIFLIPHQWLYLISRNDVTKVLRFKSLIKNLCLFWLCTSGHWQMRSRDPKYEMLTVHNQNKNNS